MEIKLNKYVDKYSVNKEGNKNIPLTSKIRVTPNADLEQTINLNTIYNEERDNCNNYRLIFTVNPICSNILFNMRTEVIKDEGSDDPIVFIGDRKVTSKTFKSQNTSDINIKQCIKDTEYSHPLCGNLTYHCGTDIFNNHRLRTTDFIHVNRVIEGDSNSVFNTLSDYLRDENGDIIEEFVGGANAYYDDKGVTPQKTKLHLHQVDTILSMGEAYTNKLSEVNGWLGFNNPTSIEIPIINRYNGEEILLNKLLNSNKTCEFIDMYPDRSLYSFIPKVNRFKRRLEHNWDYIMTYPYRSDYKKFNEVNNNYGCGGIKSVETFVSYTNNGTEVLMIRSMIKHNLKKGDYVRLYYSEPTIGDVEPTVKRFYKKVKISRIGDSEGKYTETLFGIRKMDISVLINDIQCAIEDLHLFFRKEVNDCECDYYFRQFKEIRNSEGQRLSSEINKLAYGENIYGDRIGQIIFNDTIDTEQLRDNLNRPLHEIFLTIIKRNAGRREWYTYNDFKNDVIEYSHCFGKVMSGLDMKYYFNNENKLLCTKNYNIHKIHNLNLNEINGEYRNLTHNMYVNFKTKPSVIEGADEDGIVLRDEEMILYGDIVEFNRVKYEETVLENINYRFNTEQRETSNADYYDIITDVITSDDYDFTPENNTATNSTNSFKVEETLLNKIGESKFAGNIQPEGYYYKPHNRIIINELDDTIHSVNGIILNYNKDLIVNNVTINDEYGNKTTYTEVSFKAPVDYEFVSGDIISFYDKDTRETIFGVLRKIVNLNLDIIVEYGKITQKGLQDKKYVISLCKDGCPNYAIYIPTSNVYVWRENIKMSSLTNDSELYDRPFTNGAHYIHSNINLFLKRQDPVGNYFMFNPEDDNENVPVEVNSMKSYRMYDLRTLDNNDVELAENSSIETSPLKPYRRYGWSELDISGMEYIENEIDNICY